MILILSTVLLLLLFFWVHSLDWLTVVMATTGPLVLRLLEQRKWVRTRTFFFSFFGRKSLTMCCLHIVRNYTPLPWGRSIYINDLEFFIRELSLSTHLFGFPCGPALRNLPVMQKTQETQVRSMDRKDPLEKDMTTPPVYLPGESHELRILAGCSP